MCVCVNDIYNMYVMLYIYMSYIERVSAPLCFDGLEVEAESGLALDESLS